MKKSAIILALVCILTCSCSCTTAPPAESPAESSTEAATTEATAETTTEAFTEAKEIEQFKPTEDNVIWGEGAGLFMPLKQGAKRIEISEALAELIDSANETDRIAILYYVVDDIDDETQTPGAEAIDPFCLLPEGYKEQYVHREFLAFMTRDEISKLVVNKHTAIIMESVEYGQVCHLIETDSADVES